MHSSRGRHVWRATTLVGVLLLAGCTTTQGPTTTPEPSPEAPVTTEPTPTPTPEAPVAPERPAAMDQADVAGAEALARYVLELYRYSYATGDLAELRQVSDPGCGFCSSIIENVTALHAAGGRDEGSVITWHTLEGRHIAGGRYAVEGTYTEGPSTEYDSDGNVASERVESKHYEIVYALEFTESWKVLAVDVLESAGPPS